MLSVIGIKLTLDALLFSFWNECEGNICRLVGVELNKQLEDFFLLLLNQILSLLFSSSYQQCNKGEENLNHINMLSVSRKVSWMPSQQTTLHNVTGVQGLKWNVSQWFKAKNFVLFLWISHLWTHNSVTKLINRTSVYVNTTLDYLREDIIGCSEEDHRRPPTSRLAAFCWCESLQKKKTEVNEK